MPQIADIHCHILPGVDDGVQTMDTAVGLIEIAYEQGVHYMILTPHFRKHMFETDERIISARYAELKKIVKKRIPKMELYLGCEFHVNMDMIEILRSRQYSSMAGTSYILTEFSSSDSRNYIKDRLYQLLLAGYIPIIAHAERYDSILGDVEYLEELVEMGICVQINADSILGYEGRKVKKYCRKLMKRDLIHFIGSDCHDRKERPSHLAECAAYLDKKMGPAYREQLMLKNPLKIIEMAEEYNGNK